MRREFERRHVQAELAFAAVPLHLSFRSAPAVLEGVDGCSRVEDGLARRQRGDDEPPPPHEAFPRPAGPVEIWPPIAPSRAPEPERLALPLDAQSATTRRSRSPSASPPSIARWTRGRVASERVVDGDAGALRRSGAGDILILVRSRGALFEAMTRALRRARIPAAGADRLTLRDHIAVMDLFAAGRAALRPTTTSRSPPC